MIQLELFQDDCRPVLVKLLVVYESPELPGVLEQTYFEFVDMAPHLPRQKEIVDEYMQIEDSVIDIWMGDVPKPGVVKPTHQATFRSQ